jgi:molecular chaperone DnaK
MAADNKLLGQFDLVGIPPAPRGMPQVEVTFDIDANGIVHVAAKDLGTGKEQKITITASSGLNEEEIKKMVRDAESHADEDKQRRALIEDRNKLDTLVYSTEKSLGEHAQKLPAAEKSQLDDALAAAKTALEGEDHGAIKSALESLTKASHKLAEVIYQQTAAGGGAQSQPAQQPGGARPSEDGVIDAEYVDVDKKD